MSTTPTTTEATTCEGTWSTYAETFENISADSRPGFYVDEISIQRCSGCDEGFAIARFYARWDDKHMTTDAVEVPAWLMDSPHLAAEWVAEGVYLKHSNR